MKTFTVVVKKMLTSLTAKMVNCTLLMRTSVQNAFPEYHQYYDQPRAQVQRSLDVMRDFSIKCPRTDISPT